MSAARFTTSAIRTLMEPEHSPSPRHARRLCWATRLLPFIPMTNVIVTLPAAMSFCHFWSAGFPSSRIATSTASSARVHSRSHPRTTSTTLKSGGVMAWRRSTSSIRTRPLTRTAALTPAWTVSRLAKRSWRISRPVASSKKSKPSTTGSVCVTGARRLSSHSCRSSGS